VNMKITDSAGRSAAIYPLYKNDGHAGDSGRQPAVKTPLIFVTGASRSGARMLARMLGSHGSVMTFSPLNFFGTVCDTSNCETPLSEGSLANMAAVLLARQNHGLWGGKPTAVEQAWGRHLVSYLSPEECTAAGLYAAVLRQLSEDAGKPFACDPSPGNIAHAKRLLDTYENARVIHIVRDPRAVLASRKNLGSLTRLGIVDLPASEVLRNRVSYHPYTMSKLWAKASEQASQLMGHPRFMSIRFEDLVAHPDAGARRLCNFLGIGFETGMIDVPRWAAADVDRVSDQDIAYRTIPTRWQDSLSRSEALTCEKVTHRMMQRFGYNLEFLGRFGRVSSLPSVLSYPLHVAGVVILNPVRVLSEIAGKLWHPRGSGADSAAGARGVD
jgi:hypothetical protein